MAWDVVDVVSWQIKFYFYFHKTDIFSKGIASDREKQQKIMARILEQKKKEKLKIVIDKQFRMLKSKLA